jgi:ribosome biogenesis GTPase
VDTEPTDDALRALGWNEHWQALFASIGRDDLTPARVVRSDRGSVLVAGQRGVLRAKPATRLVKAAAGAADLPAVGDWVALADDASLDVALVEAVLHRRGAIARGEPGRGSDVQVLAANVDVVFVVHPIAEPPNLRRIERELSLAWDSGAVPVVVLTKADLSADPARACAAVEAIAIGVDVLAINALERDGADPLRTYLAGPRTAVLLGPSGAGKSTLVNALLGERRQATGAVREADQRGRHTTVARELVALPGGGVLIDTPGLRALGLTGSEEGIAATFAEIEELAEACRFRDCAHVDEPGCAVRAAIEAGALPPDRLAGYHKLLREAEVAAARSDARLRAEEDRRSKTIAKAIKDYYKLTGRG